jgi:hypothetical protein
MKENSKKYMPPLEWTCHVCGELRPDDKISVHSRTVTIRAIPITENVRYCNDNPECIEGAKKVRWIEDDD